MRRTNVYLDEAQTAMLDEVAREQGISRAELVRRLLHQRMSDAPVDRDADLATIEDSFAALAGEHFVSRGPGEREAGSERIRNS